MKPVLSALKFAVFAGSVSLIGACRSESITSFYGANLNHAIEVSAGKRFDIELRGGFVGSFDSPSVSSAAVEFLNSEIVAENPPPPGGQLQRFHFRAVQAGTAILSFASSNGPTSVDTIVVR